MFANDCILRMRLVILMQAPDQGGDGEESIGIGQKQQGDGREKQGRGRDCNIHKLF